MKKSKSAQITSAAAAGKSGAPLRVWGERRRDPDWDRYLGALLALALRRADEEDSDEEPT